MEEEDLVGNTARVGGMFKDELGTLQEEFPVVSNVLGRGLILAFDLPDVDSRDEFRRHCWEAGFATLACGNCTVRFRPPLVFTEADVNQAMSTMRTVLS